MILRVSLLSLFGAMVCLGLAGCAADVPGFGSDASSRSGSAPVRRMKVAFDPVAAVGVSHACFTNVMTMPLLTRNGSPAVAVTINGVSGAAYLHPLATYTTVYSVPGIFYPTREHTDITSIAYSYSTSFTHLRTLQIAQGTADDIDAIKVGHNRQERIAGLIALGEIGFNILAHYDLLLDMPHQRAMLFNMTGKPGCPPLKQWIKHAFVADFTTNAFRDRNSVTARLGHHPVEMILDPLSNVSIISRDDAEDAGLTDAASATDDDVRTAAGGRVMLGTRHSFADVAIGDWVAPHFDVNVEPSQFNVLGLNFFRQRTVIMGFADGVMVFSAPHPDLLPPDTTRAGPDPVMSRLATTHVTQGR